MKQKGFFDENDRLKGLWVSLKTLLVFRDTPQARRSAGTVE